MRIDKSFLPPALAEIGIISDAHFVLPSAPSSLEFPSRSKQTARSEFAVTLLKEIKAELIVHLGDLTQEAPESPLSSAAQTLALNVFDRSQIEPLWVAGNHDVGDKTDPTMPTHPVSEKSLARYEKIFGPSWYTREFSGVLLVFINSQLLNSALETRSVQRRWLEKTLADASGQRIILFLHLPLFLDSPLEPGLGHYDNISEPDRSWLLDLIHRHNVELVISGHVHQRFLNAIGSSLLVTLPSPAFTRPGFSQVFASAPPPERGRDDTPKLGVTLLRIRETHVDMHFIRTEGRSLSDQTVHGALLATPLSGDHANPKLCVSLLHSITSSGEIPEAWPAAIRQPIRNDYPLLSILELAPGWIRVPLEDFAHPLFGERIRLARKLGIKVVGTVLWNGSPTENWMALLSQCDELEIRLPGRIPNGETVRKIAQFTRGAIFPISISPIFPNEIVPGKQLSRTRLAWFFEELPELNRLFLENAWYPASVLVQATNIEASTFEKPSELKTFTFSVDFLLTATSISEDDFTRNAIELLANVYQRDKSRVFIQPLQSHDRTMDVASGLLDDLCNPTKTFHVVKNLHALYASGKIHQPSCYVDAKSLHSAIRKKNGNPFCVDLIRGIILDQPPEIDATGHWLLANHLRET